MNSKLLELVSYIRNECPSQLSPLAQQDMDIVRNHMNLTLAEGLATLSTYVEDIGWVDVNVELEPDEDGVYYIDLMNPSIDLAMSITLTPEELEEISLEDLYHKVILGVLFAEVA